MGTDAPNSFLVKIQRALRLDRLPAGVRRVLVGIIGSLVLVVGLAMIFLPGPAFIMVPLGLAILATEFVWAQRLLTKAKAYFDKQRQRVADKMRGKK